jgi:hypothetical protein
MQEVGYQAQLAPDSCIHAVVRLCGENGIYGKILKINQ